MDAENHRLQTELEHTKWEVDSLLQERNQWKHKFQHSQQELFQMNGSCARNNREMKLLQEENDEMKQQLAIKDGKIQNVTKIITRLEEQVKSEQSQFNALYFNYHETLLKTTQAAGPTHDDFEEMQTQLDCLRAENATLMAISHPKESCQEFGTRAMHQVEDAKQLQAAAEAEAEALRYLQTQNDLLQQQHNEDSQRIEDLVLENVQLLSDMARSADPSRVAFEDAVHDAGQSLEAELGGQGDSPSTIHSPKFAPLSSEPTPPAFYGRASSALVAQTARGMAASPANLATPVEKTRVILSLSSVKPVVSLPPVFPTAASRLSLALSPIKHMLHHAPARKPPTIHLTLSKPHSLSTTPRHPPTTKPNIALTIHIKPSDHKALSLLSRVHSVISKTSRLEVQGPTAHVDAFVKALQSAEAEMQQLAVSARHWEKVARDAGVRDRGGCGDKGHRGLRDELAAKGAQVRMLEGLLEEWRGKGE
ncbi:hypothetical protein IAQ61_003974 [Plenodomus lingam]|uniref:Predicted protein n=1 Tax=Leptosphaeria maculans (strain JN3 / isolate v23.1.3 / race Av1-4-5-6-7-8) TaxID=985895 RepID=E4ZQU9_LEPMJ|nr:predicted protein [Plenodomus lingam JN3]KAH9874784.1 hypothetical protein IAQ61_003974 [Plenodomus lingam]CBX94104.1 predicted protein [Plenodomus lingam JN3]